MADYDLNLYDPQSLHAVVENSFSKVLLLRVAYTVEQSMVRRKPARFDKVF